MLSLSVPGTLGKLGVVPVCVKVLQEFKILKSFFDSSGLIFVF